jgi:YD repeat-containing protein
MAAGGSYSVSVTMKNTGSTPWTAPRLYRLGSQSPQDNFTWGMSRVYLTSDVLPGANATFNFSVIAPLGMPARPSGGGGTHYAFQWRMVQDGVAWFGDPGPNTDIVSFGSFQPIYEYTPLDHYSARLEPRNRTGVGEDDLLSRNFNWSSGILGLPGRAGLDLNLSLSYNSLVWTKVRSAFVFDADQGFPSAGFRLGFPTIQAKFRSRQANAYSYLMITPSGGHVELRQVSAAVYESVDGSHLKLTEGDGNGLLLTDTSGTQMTYLLINGEFRCTGIKDRNGNYLTIKYDPVNGVPNPGRLTAIIDTLGRTINFNYDTNYRLQKITQARNGQEHIWATFAYESRTVQTNFIDESSDDGTTIVSGLPDNQTIAVLTQIGLDDGSRYKFSYTSWGQVYKVTRFAADSAADEHHPLSYVSYNLPLTSSTAQTDCPRFTERRDWAENWNGGSEAVTSFAYNTDAIGPNGTDWDSLEWSQVALPDGTKYREYSIVGYHNWRRGLVTKTEIYAADNSNTPKKTTVTDWVQDRANAGYQLNPRVTGSTISDSDGNRRRTTIDYAAFGLPSDVFEWGPSGTNDWRILRRTHTDYNLSEAYVSRRIIGLVAVQYLFAADTPNGSGAQTLLAKTTFQYDVNAICSGPCYTFAPEASSDPVVQHDNNYGAGFTIGRGLLAKVQRWDAFDEMNESKATASSMVYNVYGSIIRSVDPLLHATQIQYDDAFSNDGVAGNPAPYVTMAYPTAVIDADGYVSRARYNYDLGLVTQQQDPKGAAQTTEYDSVGRVKRTTNAVNGAYTRVVYPLSQTIVNKFTTIQEGQGAAYSATIFDGAGRVRAVAGDFPGSTGHYSGQFTVYDQLGRAVQSTNPTEMNHAWAASGDDAVGWYSSSQTYDWKGRALVTTNPDGTMKEASYGGCGCAGGAVVTLTDEGTMDAGVFKRRQQKIYSDSLGRTLKSEILNWQGGSVYSTTVNTYNARDQVTLVRQYQGNDTSTVYQDTVMTYDGYGRPKTRHIPEQDANTATSYDYNVDETLRKVTDARGATSSFTYNNRHLIKTVTYEAPSGITPTAPVTFAYDSAGNRISMADGLGSKSYHYDQMSRMEWEERSFTGLGTYRLTYGYNLAGELTTFTDSFNATVTYDRDAAGKVSGVTGSGFGNISSYASNFHYRASGKLRTLMYGNNRTLSVNYDPRLRPSHYEVSGVMALDYQYYADGRLNFADDLTNSVFDRSYQYDQVGRMTTALSGAEARGEPATNNRPYNQSFGYDAWDNMSARAAKHWSKNIPTVPLVEVNNRVNGWQYDADGRATVTNSVTSTFDAAGRLIQTTSPQRRNNPPLTLTQSFDGDGNRVKKSEYGLTTFFLRSTVLGGAVLMEIYGTPGQMNLGQKSLGHVYVNGSELAEQNTYLNTAFYKHDEPGSGEQGTSYTHPDGSNLSGKTQLDPLNDEVGEEDPYLPDPGGGDPGGGDPGFDYPRHGDLSDPHSGCTVDGIPWPCTSIGIYLGNSGAAKSVTAGPDAGMLMPRYEWRFNDSSGGEDACKNGVCPSVVTIDDPGGYFAVAGFDIVSNTPTMRVMTPQKTNPNCIENAVPGGKLSGRGLSEAVSAASGKPVLTGKPAHNGEHVLIPPGTTAPVHTLPLMAGTILHGSRQNSNPREHAYNFAIIDILLNVTIEGEKYVMTLADQFYKGAKVTGRITTNTPLGTIEGTDNPLNESGLHITLLPYSIWKTYIADPGFPRGARDSVPYSSLMSVGHDPRSPFRCP